MSVEHTIHTIVTALNEIEERPRSQIAAVVLTLGEEAALALLVEANEIERTGGMMLPDGSRRRTPGGVFFTLARRRLTPEDRDVIFPKTPPRTDGAPRTSEAIPKKPDRRHVRLISAAPPPPIVRVKPVGAVAGAGVAALGADELPIGDPPASTIGGASSPSANEVKLVRLDRRRIIQLPPLPAPDPPAEPRRRRTGTANDPAQNGVGARRSSGDSLQPKHEGPPAEQPAKAGLRSRAGRDAGLARSSVRKQLAAFLDELEESERRLVLLDMLGEVDREKPDTGRQGKVESDLRERVLAAVGHRLGISVGRLALTIFGADTPAHRRRVKALQSELETN